MDTNTGGTYTEFIKENFRPLKLKEGPGIRLGRRTNKWILEHEHKARLSHLTIDNLEKMIKKYELTAVKFDDGYTYVVKTDVEREIMVEFYSKKEEAESLAVSGELIHDMPVFEDELIQNCRISDSAIETITGDDIEDIDLKPDAAVDFISQDMLEQALADEKVRIFADEGGYTIISCEEEQPEGETYPLFLERPLPCTEIPLSSLDPKKSTAITGQYRDDVSSSEHEFEHNVTHLDD